MKKLLTTLFAVFVVVSAFATVDVQTTTPNVYYQGACERVGTMRFIVSNDQDYQLINTQQFVLIKIQLTDGASLCKNLFSDANGDPVWGTVEVDGTHWSTDQVKAFGAAGDDVIYVKICAAPDTTTAINANSQAWFVLGNTQAVTNNHGAGYTGYTENAICVNFQGSSFQQNDFFRVAFDDFTVADDCSDDTIDPRNMAGSRLGTSYNLINPIAYGVPRNDANFIIGATCAAKSGNTDADLSQIANSTDVTLCQCYVYHPGDQNTPESYECHDLYRVGTLVLNDGSCQAYLKEDTTGMLPADSVIEFSVVDASGNPIDVYFATAPTLTTDATSGLTITGPTYVDLVDAAGTGAYSDDMYASGRDGLAGCPEHYDACVDNYDLYEKVQYSVTTASTAGAGTIYLDNFDLARLTSDGPIEAYLKVSWYPLPCGTGNSKVIMKSLKFVDCPDESEYQPTYYQNALYFPYFPKTTGWWSGLAITNVNYYYQNVLPTVMSYWFDSTGFGYIGVDQDVNVTLYLIEEDGDVYVYDAGTLPKSGILTVLLSDPAFSPVLMSGYTDDAFGDERFWVVAVGTATVGDTPIVLDGFGMLGDGTQAQGFLPRIPIAYDAVVTEFFGYLNNK